MKRQLYHSNIIMLCLLIGAGVLVGSCNSHTPVEFDNVHDPLSEKYSPSKTLPPYNLRLTSVTDSGFCIAWLDTNKWYNGLSQHNQVVLERSVDEGAFSELARVNSQIHSFSDHEIDTAHSYHYRMKESTPSDTSSYSAELTVRYTDIAQTTNSLNLGSPVQSLTVSPDGTMLAAVGADCVLKVWHLGDYRLLGDFTRERVASRGWPYTAAFSPDSKMIAVNAGANGNTSVNICRIADLTFIKQINGGTGSVARSLCFSDDGTKIMVGTPRATVEVYDIGAASLVRTIPVFPGNGIEAEVNLLYVPRDGKTVIVGGIGLSKVGFKIFRSSDWSLILDSYGFTSVFYTVSLDEKYVMLAMDYGTQIISLEGGSTLQYFGEYTGKSALTYDDRLLIGQQDGTLYIGQVSSGLISFTKSLSLPPDSYPAVVCLPDSYEFIASGISSGEIDVWKIVRGWSITK